MCAFAQFFFLILRKISKQVKRIKKVIQRIDGKRNFYFFFPLNGNYIFGINMFRCYSYSILLLMGQGYYIIIMHRYVIEVKIGMGKTVDMLTLLGHAIQLCEMMIVGLIM